MFTSCVNVPGLSPVWRWKNKLNIVSQAKGFDPMIEASKRGLPVDIDKIPPSLSAPAVTSPNKKVLSRQNTLPQVLQLTILSRTPKKNSLSHILGL